MWALQTYQILIASELILNEDQQEVQLLNEPLIPPPEKPLKTSPGEPKLRSRPRKDVLGKQTQISALN